MKTASFVADWQYSLNGYAVITVKAGDVVDLPEDVYAWAKDAGVLKRKSDSKGGAAATTDEKTEGRSSEDLLDG